MCIINITTATALILPLAMLHQAAEMRQEVLSFESTDIVDIQLPPGVWLPATPSF